LYDVFVEADHVLDANALAREENVGDYAHNFLQPVRNFVKRPELLEQIERQLRTDENDNGPRQQYRSRVLTVWRLAGVGKSQLVLDYLDCHRADYKATFWIGASQKSTIERDFINIYQLLFNVAWSVGDGWDRIEEAVIRVKSWLGQPGARWLLVFDGADSVDIPDNPEYVVLDHFMPQSSFVDVIVTSRSEMVQELGTHGSVHVREMGHHQAVELFCKASNFTTPSAKTTGEVGRIVEDLGCLALAVNLAGTYVRETPPLRSNVGAYMIELQERRKNLFQRMPTRLVQQYGENVLTTWEMSFLAVKDEFPEAACLLTLTAFLSHDDIYLDLFGLDREATGRDDREDDHEDRRIMMWEALLLPKKGIGLQVEECFRILARYSLVQWQGKQAGYGTHRLFHTWGYDRLSTVEREVFTMASIDLICNAITRCDAARQEKLRLAPHVVTSFRAVSYAALNTLSHDDTLRRVQRMGFLLDEQGWWSDVCVIKRFIFQTYSRVHGGEHPDTIDTMNNLASALETRAS
jgi:hypothetical protein